MNVVGDTGLVRLCNVANHAENPETWVQYLQTETIQKTAWVFFVHLVEKLTDQQNPKVVTYSKRYDPETELGPAKDMYIFDREGCTGIDVKVPSTKNPEKLVWVSACTK